MPNCQTLRLHQWLVLLALIFACAGVRAESIYKCVAADGAIAYQSTPCKASQTTHTLDIAPAPALAPSPIYALDKAKPLSRMESRRELHASRKKTELAFECRGSGGEVFYRLGHCPHSVAGESSGRKSGSAKSVSVSGHPVARSEACSEMRRAGAIGRKGHEFDESISSYDRNVGNDPCK